MSTEVSIQDEESFFAAIADVRSDSSATNWWAQENCPASHLMLLNLGGGIEL